MNYNKFEEKNQILFKDKLIDLLSAKKVAVRECEIYMIDSSFFSPFRKTSALYADFCYVYRSYYPTMVNRLECRRGKKVTNRRVYFRKS